MLQAPRTAGTRGVPAPPTDRRLPGPLLALAVGGIYAVLAAMAIVMSQPMGSGASFWPAAGVTFAVLLRQPAHRWGWVLGGVATADLGVALTSGAPPVAALLWCAGNLLEPVVGASLAGRLGNREGLPTPVGNLLRVLLPGVLVGPALGAAVGAVGTALSYPVPYAMVWGQWLLGDGLGVLVVAPALLTIGRGQHPRRHPAEAVGLAAVTAIVALAAFRSWSVGWDLALPYLVLPLITWAALRHGMRGAAWWTLVVTQIANWATAFGVGPFAAAGARTGEPVIMLQLFLVAVATTGLILAAVVSELSTRDEVEHRLQAQAFRDHLTGLPNRAWLDLHLSALLARDTGQVALFVCDLDHFKVVNDGLGHEAGDALICEIADRLQQAVRPGDGVARLGGDEFVVVLDDVDDRTIDLITHRILDRVAQPVWLSGAERVPSLCVGVAVSSSHSTAGTLLRDADTAMYRAKELGRGRVVRFDDQLRAQVVDRLMIEGELRPALERGEITCVHQPEIDLRTGELFGFESLARWTHYRHGPIGPDRFVPIAVATGRASALFTAMLEQTLQDQAAWRSALGCHASVAVNVSPAQLSDPFLVSTITAALARWEAPPTSLWLEVTEEALEADGSLATLEALQRVGVRIALDDFGVGWSSMDRLASFGWDLLKIDRSFTAAIAVNDNGIQVVQAIIAMAHALGIPTVGEGVEEVRQLRLLTELGCDYAQGYLIGRPMAADQALAFALRDVARQGGTAAAPARILPG